jgi:hypothetical protein
MDLREAILQEHSKKQTTKITRYIGNDAARFAELMRLFFGNEYRVTQRASWVVSYCAEAHPALIRPYLEKMVRNLEKPDLHDAVKRNTLKIFGELDMPVKLQGRIVDICFNALTGQEPIAMKAHAITILTNICKKEPGLKDEFRVVLEEQLPYGSAAILSRGKKALKELEKITSL